MNLLRKSRSKKVKMMKIQAMVIDEDQDILDEKTEKNGRCF